MKYSPIHKSLIIAPEDLQRASFMLLHILRSARKLGNIPLTAGKKPADNSDLFSIEQSVVQCAKNIGIDFGKEWGHEIDVSNIS